MDDPRQPSQLEGFDDADLGELFPAFYDELRRMASRKLSQESPDNSFQTTSLIHEAYLRLVASKPTHEWKNRAHFFGAAAEAMRRILVDHARHKARVKHGGHMKRLNIEHVDEVTNVPPEELLLLDEALAQLANHDAQAAELVKLRYFAGLSVEDAAEFVGISRAAAYRHWNFAKAWLLARIRS